MKYIQEYLDKIQNELIPMSTGMVQAVKVGQKIATKPTLAARAGSYGYMGALMLPAIFKWYLDSLRSAVKGCENMQAKEKSACIIKNKIRVLNGLISKLNAAKSKCKGNERCIKKVDAKIMKQKEKMKKLQDQLRAVVSQKYGG